GAGQDVEPAISRDGIQIAFSTLKQNADIWKLPVKPEGDPVAAAEPVIATTREDSRGAWSIDGKHVAFNSDPAADMNIWVHSLADRATRQITRGAGGDYQPNWSPDGKRIAFFSSRDGTPNILRVDLETQELRRLTNDSWININPFYSPDGKWIAYQ